MYLLHIYNTLNLAYFLDVKTFAYINFRGIQNFSRKFLRLKLVNCLCIPVFFINFQYGVFTQNVRHPFSGLESVMVLLSPRWCVCYCKSHCGGVFYDFVNYTHTRFLYLILTKRDGMYLCNNSKPDPFHMTKSKTTFFSFPL